MTQNEKIKRISRLLKKEIPILTPEEAIHLAFLIVQELEEPNNKTTDIEREK